MCCGAWTLPQQARAQQATHVRSNAHLLPCPTKCDILHDTKGSSAGSRNSRREQQFLKLSRSQHPLHLHCSHPMYPLTQAMDQIQALPLHHRCMCRIFCRPQAKARSLHFPSLSNPEAADQSTSSGTTCTTHTASVSMPRMPGCGYCRASGFPAKCVETVDQLENRYTEHRYDCDLALMHSTLISFNFLHNDSPPLPASPH